MNEIAELREIAYVARRSIEPGLQADGSGSYKSAGACLHACLIVVMLFTNFGNFIPTVRGGSDGAGAFDTLGNWRGHYWVEIKASSGAMFVVDVTADQFGHDAVVVLPFDEASERYRKGPQAEVDEVFADLLNEYNYRDVVAA